VAAKKFMTKSFLMAFWWPRAFLRKTKGTLNNCQTFSLENMECLMALEHLSMKNNE
jgi:hypothetical protein